MWRPYLIPQNIPQNTPQKDILILTAGIGITIATSIVSSIKKASYTSHVSVAHSVQYEKDAALWDEIIHDINNINDATACLFITQEKEKADTQHKKYGRVNIPLITKDLTLDNIQVFLCGPQKFNHAMNQALTEKGIDSSSIHEDIFSSPVAPSQLTNKKSSLTTPTPITFIHVSGERSTFTWQPQDGTLLNAAEKNNISITANCRSGACRACLYAIEGEVENLSSPASPAPKKWAYLCCAAPLSPLTITERSPI
jgi:ferredoxin-NADP reductase